MMWVKYVSGIIGSGFMFILVLHMITLGGLFLIDIEAAIKSEGGDASRFVGLAWLYVPTWMIGATLCAIGTWPLRRVG